MHPKPSVFHRAISDRLSSRKKMTVAVGFVCKDGVVLAADTKESYGLDDHTYVDKIARLDMGDCQVGIAGAGDAYLLDYITPRIKNLIAGRSHWNLESFSNELEQLMARIYGSKAIRVYPKAAPTEMYTSLLLAIRFKDERPSLFAINSSLVTQVIGEPQVIGYGPMREMARELWSLNPNVREASTAALHLISDAKRRYGAAGGVTHIFNLFDSGETEFQRTWDQPEKESLLNDLRMLYYRLVVTVATPSIESREYAKIMRNLSGRTTRIRAEFQKIEKEYEAWYLQMIGIGTVKLEDLPPHVQKHIRSVQQQNVGEEPKRSAARKSRGQR